MKIAVASEGKDLDSKVSMVSGRAPFYLIFEDGTLADTVKNPFAVGGGGAGWGVAKMLHDKGVELVVSGKFGENMMTAMKDKGMDSFSVEDMTVEEALDAVKAKYSL